MKFNDKIIFLRHIVVVLFFCIGGCMWTSCIPKKDILSDGQYKALIIFSYRNDSPWVRELEDGIRKGFKDEKLSVDFDKLYLNCELTDEKEQLKQINKQFDEFKAPDILFVYGDQATRVLLSSNHSFTYQIPIVFCGVDYFDKEWLGSRQNVTGFTTTPDYEKTVHLIRSLYPNMKGLIIDLDDSWLSKNALDEFNRQWKKVQDTIPVKVNNMDEGLGSSFMWNAKFQNEEPRIMPVWSSFYSSRARNTEIPFFSVNNKGLGQGYVGGYITLAYDQGCQAAEAGGKILRGDAVTNIPIQQYEKKLVFDWMQLKKMGISRDQLPAESEYINLSFMEKKENQMMAVFVFAIVLILCIAIILIFLYQKAQRVKKKTQKELMGHRTRLKTVMSSIREGVISIDKDMRIFAVNPAALSSLQLEGNGERYKERSILSLIEISDAKRDCYLESIIKDVFRTLQSIPFEASYISSILTNNIFPISGSISPIYQNNDLYGAVIVFHDITEDLSQKEFLSLTLGVGDVVPWRLDYPNRKIIIDHSFFDKFEIEDDGSHELSLDYLSTIIHPEDLSKWHDVNSKLISGLVDTMVFEMRMDVNSAGYQWWELRYTCLRALSKEEVPVIFGFIRNIEDIKERLATIEKARDKAQLSDRLKSAFLANMSHEIRTPLNAIVGFSNVLTSGDDYALEERQVFIETIKSNCNLLLALISDVLDMAQIETGGMVFKEEVCDLNEFISQIIITQRVIVPARIQLIGDVPPETTFVTTDKLRLNQVITNLINNAVKFTDKGKVTIGYTKDNEFIYFFVEDTGRGIPEKDLYNIFERFFKKDDFKQGAGLGLSICKMIVDHFKGEINVTSEVGVGSRFTVTVPYLKAVPTEPPSTTFTNSNIYKINSMNPEVNDVLDQDKRVTLLIAEDEESNYLLLKTILQKHCNLIRAKTGKEALEKFDADTIDLIMLDIKMPEMTGIEALKEIRKISTSIPIIMQFAYVFDSDMENARQAGASDFVTKPINIKILKETLTKYCPKLTF